MFAVKRPKANSQNFFASTAQGLARARFRLRSKAEKG
jgi:hypothetical protein